MGCSITHFCPLYFLATVAGRKWILCKLIMMERFVMFTAICLLNCLKPVWNSWTCFNLLFFQQLSRFAILSAHIATHVYALLRFVKCCVYLLTTYMPSRECTAYQLPGQIIQVRRLSLCNWLGRTFLWYTALYCLRELHWQFSTVSIIQKLIALWYQIFTKNA